MAAKQLMLPANRAFNSNGLAISGAQAKLYLSGGLTPANFFADSGLVTSLGSTLTANGAGRFPTAYGDSTVGYRLRTLDSDGAVLDDIDPYFFGLTTGVDGANASIAVGTTTTGAAGSSATVANSGTGTNAILNFTLPAGATGPAGDVAKATDRTALAAITGQASNATRFLAEAGREGLFVWSTVNNAANVTKDPQQGVYVAPASDTTGASGTWIRHPGIATYKNIKWFGCKGDATAPGVGTDDHIALQAAINHGAATGVALYAPRGAYRNSALLTSTAPIHLFGDFVSQDSTGVATPASILGSAIYSDAGVGGLLLYYVTNLTAAGSPTIYPSAAGSVIERIQFHSAGEGAAHAGIYGFESRATCTLRDVTVRGFGDHGVHIRGSTSGGDGVVYGNVNGSILHNVNSISNAGAGLRISGNDANSITVVGGLFQVNTGYAIDNDSFQGCTFVNPICEGNTAGAVITRRPISSANTYIGIDTEGGTSVLGAKDTVIGGGLSEQNSGQTNQFSGLVHANNDAQIDGNLTAGTSVANSHVFNGAITSWNGIDIRSGSSLRLIDAAGALAISILNDGTNIDAGASSTVPLKAFSYKIGGGSTVINSSGVLQAVAFPALTGDVTTTAGSLATTLSSATVVGKLSGQALTGKLTAFTSTTGSAGLTVPHGVAPTSPVNGDLWTTTAGIFWRINSATVQVATGSGTASGTNTGDQTITLTGGVTGSGTGSFATVVASVPAAAMPALTGDVTTSAGAVATTIAANAVTFAKMQALSAGGKLLGSAVGSTAVAEITVGTGLTVGTSTLRFANISATTLLGNPTGGATTPSEITTAGGIIFSGTTLTVGALTPTSVVSTGLITSSGAGGIGYATGAGGAVTQITSRTTGVTDNVPCGAITLVSAAGSATWATFTVTDSRVAATDTIVLSQKTGANLYNAIVTAVAAGSFNVSVSAVSGTATESPVFNFAVIKAVAA